MKFRTGSPGLVAALLVAASLAGCATSSLNETDADSGGPSTVGPQGMVVSTSSSFASDKQTPRGATSGSVPKVKDAEATQAAASLAAMSNPGSESYKIGPLDILDISVYEVPDLSKTVQVSANGTINMPLVGEVSASGKTADELEQDLTSKLGSRYLQNPQVTVLVKEFNSSRITVTGEIRKPGVYPYRGESLLQFVSMAGGVTDNANSTILIVREVNGQRSAAKFNLSAIQRGRDPDPSIQAGDVIVADTSLPKKGLNAILRVLPLAGFAALL